MNGSESSTTCGHCKSPLHLAIIGSGSAAFAAAIAAVENGARVTLIEAADRIGGTCVNVGCIPSKVMIHSAGMAQLQAHHPCNGVGHTAPRIDRRAMVAEQQGLVDALRAAKYENILQGQPEITLIKGFARFVNANTLTISRPQQNETTLQADRILIATGASPHIPDITGLNDTPYWTSTEALAATELPQGLIVLGGSVVALELAQAFLHLGVKVTLLARSTLLSKEEPLIGSTLLQILEEEGMEIMTHCVPDHITHDGQHFEVQTSNGMFNAEALLVATGRRANTRNLRLENAGITTDATGRIVVDAMLQTRCTGIYAAGDCTTNPQYVYVAAAAGTRAAINMTGGNMLLDLQVLPKVVFTEPQVATVGLSEADARAQGIDVTSRNLTLENVPRARVNHDTRGFIKLVADAGSGKLLGCQVIAEAAGEIIQTAALALNQQLTVAQLATQLFPYLTMVEGLKLCAQTFNKDVSQLSCCAG